MRLTSIGISNQNTSLTNETLMLLRRQSKHPFPTTPDDIKFCRAWVSFAILFSLVVWVFSGCSVVLAQQPVTNLSQLSGKLVITDANQMLITIPDMAFNGITTGSVTNTVDGHNGTGCSTCELLLGRNGFVPAIHHPRHDAGPYKEPTLKWRITTISKESIAEFQWFGVKHYLTNSVLISSDTNVFEMKIEWVKQPKGVIPVVNPGAIGVDIYKP